MKNGILDPREAVKAIQGGTGGGENALSAALFSKQSMSSRITRQGGTERTLKKAKRTAEGAEHVSRDGGKVQTGPRPLRAAAGTFDVSPAGEESNASAFDIDPATVGTKASPRSGPLTADQRIGYAVSSIGQTLPAAVALGVDTAGQYLKNNARTAERADDPARKAIRDRMSQLVGQIDYLERFAYPTRSAARQSEQWKRLNSEMEGLKAKLDAYTVKDAVPMDSAGMRLMTGAIETREKALEGMTGAPRWLAEQGISIGQNLAMLPTAAIHPALPLAGMGAIAAGDKMYELNAQGKAPEEALGRGLLAGGIEAATEKIPLDTLMDVVKTGGRSALKNLLKQAGVEAGEESLSYVMNYIADKAARDPNASFSMAELANSAAGGAFSGLVLGGLGTATNHLAASGYLPRAGETEGALPKAVWPQKEGDPSTHGVNGTNPPPARTGSPGYGSTGQVLNMPQNGPQLTPEAPHGANLSISASSIADASAGGNTQDLASAQAQKTASTGEAGAYRAAKPENVELPTVPIINLSMRTVADMNGGVLPQTGNVLRKQVISRARTKLGLDQSSEIYIPASNVMRNGEEYVLKITRSSLDKMLSPSNGGIVSPESIAVIDNIERIANNGVYFKSEGDRKGRQQIAGYDHLMTTVYIDNQPYSVDLRVRVYDDPAGGENRLYYFTPEEIVTTKKVGAKLPTGTLHERTMIQEEVPTVAPIIADASAGGNTQSARTACGLSGPGTDGGRPLPRAGEAQGEKRYLPRARETPAAQQAQKTASTGEMGTGLVPLTEQAAANLATGKNNIVARTINDIVSFVKNARSKKGGSERLYMGTIPDSAARLIRDQTGVEVSGYTAILPGSSVQHIFKNHGDTQKEATRGQRAVSAEDIAQIPKVLASPDVVTLSEDTDVFGRPVLLFSKQIGDTYITAQAVTDGRHMLATNTLWIQKKKNPLVTESNAAKRDPAHNAQSVPPSGSSFESTPSEMNADKAAPIPTSKTPEPVLPSAPIIADSSAGGNTQSARTAGGLSGLGTDGGRPLPRAGEAQEERRYLPRAGEAPTAQQAQKTASTGEAAKRMTMADFTNVDSPVWNNVDYADKETQASIMRSTHQEMVGNGRVVQIPEHTTERVGQSFPDLRSMKKAERTPVLRQKMNELKSSLRQFLGGLKGGSYEFEVNGNVLEAKLYDTGIREVMEKITQDKASMLYHSDQVFQNAQYLYSTPDYDGDPNVYRWNYFYTPVQIGAQTVGVRIAVRDMIRQTDGTMDSQIYNWSIKKDATLGGGERGAMPDHSGASSATSILATLDGGGPGKKPNTTGVSSAAPQDAALGTSASSAASSAPIIADASAGGNTQSARTAGGLSGPGTDGGRPLPRAGEAQEEKRYLPRAGETPAAQQAQKTVSTGETVLKDYQKAEHHGDILDTVRANLGKVSKIKPVAALTGQEFQKTAGDSRNLRTKVIDFFNSIGNKVTRKDLGDIELNTSGVRDSLSHGYGKLKAATFASLPQVLEQGEIIAHNGPYEGHDYDSYIISAPVQVGNETVYVGALVIKDRMQRYKLHEVLTANESGASLFQSEATSQGADGPLRNDTPLGAPEGTPTAPIIADSSAGGNTQSARTAGGLSGLGTDGGRPLPRAGEAQEERRYLPRAGEAPTAQQAQKTASTGEAAKRMTMADFTNVDSPVWNNVDYADKETQASIMRSTHQEMVGNGRVVQIPEHTTERVGQSFPDLRSMKKAERTPVLRQKMNELKSSLRQFLGGLKGGSYEFEVNGNVLEAKLYDTGIREVMEKITQDKASMLYHSDQVFQNAQYLYSTPDYDGDPNVYRWNYFYTPVQIGAQTVGVRIAVRDMIRQTDGTMDSQIYNWSIKKDATLGGGERGAMPDHSGASSATSILATLDGGGPGKKPNTTGVSSAAPQDAALGTSASSAASSAPIIADASAGGNTQSARTAGGLSGPGTDGGRPLPRAGEAQEEKRYLPRAGETEAPGSRAEQEEVEHVEPVRPGWDVRHIESEYQAGKAGYPVVNGVQVVPFKTWVNAKDIKVDRDGSIRKFNNYGLVVGPGHTDGAGERHLAISFWNKTPRDDGVEPRATVDVKVSDLTPVAASHTPDGEDLGSLLASEPEVEEQALSQEEMRQIEELLDRAVQSAPQQPESGPAAAVKREDIGGKAKQYLKRAENRLTEKLADILSVPASAGREYLKPIVQELTDAYLETGRIPRAVYDRLFETAYQQGIVTDDTFYKLYRDLGQELRETPVRIGESDREGIADFEAFRRANFGRLKIVLQDGTPVDTLYGDLLARYPELFPADITHPADQLRQMAEAAESIRRVQTELSAYYGEDAAEFRGFAKEGFDAALEQMKPELDRIRRYIAGRAAERQDARDLKEFAGSDMTPGMLAAAEKAWKSSKTLRKAQERAVGRNLLTEQDNRTVDRLLRGDITLNELPDGINTAGVREVYEAKRAYQDAMRAVRLFNQNRKAALRAEADGLLEGAETWKDKPAGLLYSIETMERNIRDVVGDRTRAEKLIERYLAPVHRNEAQRTRMRNAYRDRVRELALSRKPAPGNRDSDAYAVQFLGEVDDNIAYLEDHAGRVKVRNGGTLEDWKGKKKEFLEANPKLDMEHIQASIQTFRDIYDELFRKMNAARIRNGYEPVDYRRGYFPHFSEKTPDGVLNDFAAALGIRVDVENLPTTINGITHTFRPGIRWSGNILRRTGDKTAYDALEGFDRYIEGISDVICHTDDIQRLRALSDQIRYRASDEAIKTRVDAILDNDTLEDVDKRAAIAELYQNVPYALSNLVVELEEYTNLLANKKSRRDRNVESDIGRGIYNAAKAIESRVAANMVAVNPASWLTNFIPLAQGGAELKPSSLLAGMWDTLCSVKSDDGFAARSTFLTNRRGSEPLVRSTSEGLSATLSTPMEWIDRFTADSLVRARYKDNRTKGMAEQASMEEADAWAAGVMADRSKGSMPTLFEARNPLIKPFTQFQLEVKNQLSHILKDVPGETAEDGAKQLALVLLKFMVGAFLFNEVYEYFIGRRPALDPIGILNDAVGDFTGYQIPNLVETGVGLVQGKEPDFRTERAKPSAAVAGLGANVAEELPFVGGLLGGGRLPIGSAIPDIPAVLKAGADLVAGEGNARKHRDKMGRELAKPFFYVAPPFGGGQIKKAYEGIRAVMKGGSYSVDSQGRDVLQYPVFTGTPLATAGTAATAALFGKTSLPTAREWVERGFRSSSAAQTAVYQALIGMGTERQTAYDVVESICNAEKQGEESRTQIQNRMLQWLEITPEEKAVVYYGLLAADAERELMDQLEEAGADPGGVYRALSGIRAAEGLKGAASSNGRRTAILESGITEEEKISIYRARISDKKDGDIAAVLEAGLDFDAYLEAQSCYTKLSEGEGKASEKSAEFARWLNQKGYHGEPYAVLREIFKFYSMVPSDETTYEKLMSAGWGDQRAYDVYQSMEGLEPLPGKNNVSGIQKARVIVDNAPNDAAAFSALEAVLPEPEFGKIGTAWQYQTPPSAYVDYREAVATLDANGNISQDEARRALDSLNLTREQKAVLWQVQNSSWKPVKNPYSTTVGQQVYASLQEQKAGQETTRITTRYGKPASGQTGVIETRYGTSGTGQAGHIRTRYGGRLGGQQSSRQAQARYGEAGSQTTGAIQTRYGGSASAGSIVTRYGA